MEHGSGPPLGSSEIASPLAQTSPAEPPPSLPEEALVEHSRAPAARAGVCPRGPRCMAGSQYSWTPKPHAGGALRGWPAQLPNS